MEWVHDLELGLFVGQWEIVAGARTLNGKRHRFKSFFDVTGEMHASPPDGG
jgi:hypothetical protein